MSNLTVVAGIPGTRIRNALRAFVRYSDKHHGRSPTIFSVEERLEPKATERANEYTPVPLDDMPLRAYGLPRGELRRLWQQEWTALFKDIERALVDGDVLLTLHLVYYSQLTREYFVAADLPQLIADLAPHQPSIITLVDDVYDCHYALVGDGDSSGMFEPPRALPRVILDVLQILDWRSMELMLADSLAAAVSKTAHKIFAVKHPHQTLYDLLYSEKRTAYFSHPITQPRNSWNAGDTEAAVALASKMARVISRLQASYTVIEPTAIDELRFLGEYGKVSQRWPFTEDSDRDLVYVNPSPAVPENAQQLVFPVAWNADARPIPSEPPARNTEPELSEDLKAMPRLIPHLQEAIENQINARDHALVEQSTTIACYRPLYRGVVSGGVLEELQHHSKLVSLGLKRAEACIVLHPPEDQDAFIAAKISEALDAWILQGRIAVPSDMAMSALKEELTALGIKALTGSDGVRNVLRVAEKHDCQILAPGGPLSRPPRARQQEEAARFCGRLRNAADSYLAKLEKEEHVIVAKDEQTFYTYLENQAVTRSERRESSD